MITELVNVESIFSQDSRHIDYLYFNKDEE